MTIDIKSSTLLKYGSLLALLLVACSCAGPVAFAGERLDDGIPGFDPSFNGQEVLTRFDSPEFNHSPPDHPTLGPNTSDSSDSNRPPIDQSRFEALILRSDFANAIVYDSNLFNSRRNPEGELILTPTGTLGLYRGEPGVTPTFFENEYSVTYIDYSEHDKLDQLSHLNRTRYDWYGKKNSLRVYNNFRPLSPRETTDRREFRGVDSRASVTATSNQFGVRFGHEISPRIFFEGDFKHEIYYFPESVGGNSSADELLSHQNHFISPKIVYELSAKTKVFIEYGFETADYFKGGEFRFKSHRLQSGFLTQFNPKLSYQFQSGYKTRNFGEQVYRDEDLFIYKTAVNYQFTSKLSGSIYGSRDLGLDLDLDGFVGPEISISRDVTSAGVVLALDDTLWSQWTIQAAVGWGSKDGQATLPDPDDLTIVHTREKLDHSYSLGASYFWRRSPLDAYKIAYRFLSKNSSFKNFEYEEHQILFAVHLDLNAREVG